MKSGSGICIFVIYILTKRISEVDWIIGAIHIPVRPVDEPQRIFGGEAAGVRIVDAMTVVSEPEAVAQRFAGGEGDAVQVGAGPGADAAESRIGVGLAGLAAFVRKRGNRPQAVGVDHLPLPGRAVDEGDPLDRLVQAGTVDPRPDNLVARVHLRHHIGPIIDEPRG